jgi:hypothetical protein
VAFAASATRRTRLARAHAIAPVSDLLILAAERISPQVPSPSIDRFLPRSLPLAGTPVCDPDPEADIYFQLLPLLVPVPLASTFRDGAYCIDMTDGVLVCKGMHLRQSVRNPRNTQTHKYSKNTRVPRPLVLVNHWQLGLQPAIDTTFTIHGV